MGKTISVQFSSAEKKTYCSGITLLEMCRDITNPVPVVAARVNNSIRDLQTTIDRDSHIEFLDIRTEEGSKVYQRSLTLLMIAAARELFPHGQVTVEHSLSKGLYCELYLGHSLTQQDVAALQAKMREMVIADLPISKKIMPVPEAIELFEKNGQVENAKLLKQLQRDTVTIYYCGNVCDYLYGTMVPSTGYLNTFELLFYKSGFILRFPEKNQPDCLPLFVDQPKLAGIFAEAEQWGKILNCGYVTSLNNYVLSGEIDDIIRVAEALHEKKIAQIADFVSEHRNEVRLILVAGPSSSGKTTFAQRLGIQLRVNGVRPVPISLDDYFVDRAHTPRDEKGEYDFEAIEAIDLELFNQHLTELLKGNSVEIPYFNFLTGEREFRGKIITLEKGQPLIIEGIHGLNEKLTSSVSRALKIKIYISALTQLSIDNHNRIPTTDARLIRRIVRDNQFRGHDALTTLRLWPSVRRGEERNIFPFQEEADIMFNSALIYELAVLKPYAEPLLQQITAENREYSEARRLLNFLAHFESIHNDEDIPTNSILREFSGNSCFH